MNPILEIVIEKRGGHYCHAVEVEDVEELYNIAESIYGEYSNEFSKEVILEFLESLTVYCLNDVNEEKIYNFSFTDALEKCNY